MNLRNYILGLLASVAVFAACEPQEEVLVPAALKASETSIAVPMDGATTASFALKATRDWTAVVEPENSGFTVTPLSGKGLGDQQYATIVVSADKNDGKDRHAILTFTSGELEPVTVKLYQEGALGGIWTLKEIREWGTEQPFPLGAKIEAVVVSNKEISTVTNVTAYVQDETAGLQLRFGAAHSFAKGDKISVSLEGLKLSTYQGATQIDAIPLEKAIVLSNKNEITPVTVSLADFMANKYEAQYIYLDANVQPRADFQNKAQEETPSDTPTTDTPEPTAEGGETEEEVTYTFVNDASENYDEVWFETESGENFTIKTYKGSTIKNTPIPAKSGKLKGIANIQEGRLQIIFTSEEDFAGLDQPYFESAFYVTFEKGSDWVGEAAGTYTLSVTSNAEWTVESSSEWATLSQTSGNGNAEITITYGAATEGAEPNIAEFTFSFAGNTAVFTLTQRVVETLTIAQFLEKEVNNDIYYRVTGIITSYYDSGYGTDTSKKKGRIVIKDETGEVLIYGLSPVKNGSQDDYKTLGLRVGDEVTVECTRIEHEGSPQGGNAYLISSVENVPDPEEAPISTVYEAQDDDLVKVSGTVMALCKKGFIIEDESAAILIFENKTPTVKIGNKVTVTGSRDTYNEGAQISAIEEIEVTDSSEETPAYLETIDLTATVDSYTFPKSEYIKFKGNVSISSTGYVNIYPQGTTKYFSLYSQIQDMSSVDGGVITAYAYVVNKYQEKAFNVVLVSYEVEDFLAVKNKEVTVDAFATSAKFTVNSNVAWTVTTDAEWITSYTQSGENGADINVSFDANASTEADRTATFTLSSEGLESVVCTLVQKKYVEPSGNETVDALTSVNTGVKDMSGSSYASWTVTEGFAAQYAGQSMPGKDYFQLRENNNNSGIVSTTSGGKVKKVVVTVDSSTNTARKVKIYASNTPYSTPADLYDDAKKGTEIETITCNETTLTCDISGDYRYVGIRVTGGTVYLSGINITWEN